MKRPLQPVVRAITAGLAVSLLALLAACATANADGPRGSAFRCNPSGDIEERLACDGR